MAAAGSARTGERLHVNTPLGGVQFECLQRALLAQPLREVNIFVAAIVPRARVALAVLVAHHAAQGIKHGARGEILRRNQHQAVALPLLLVLNNVAQLWIRLRQRLVQRLRPLRAEGHVAPADDVRNRDHVILPITNKCCAQLTCRDDEEAARKEAIARCGRAKRRTPRRSCAFMF